MKNCNCYNQSGFEDDDLPRICRDPSHNPPTHLYIPPGQRYRHICPSCGYEVLIRSSAPTFLKGWHYNGEQPPVKMPDSMPDFNFATQFLLLQSSIL